MEAHDCWTNLIGRVLPGTAFVELAFGHRRLEAARLAGLDEIPIVLLDLSNEDMLQYMIAENGTQRDRANVMREAAAGIVKLLLTALAEKDTRIIPKAKLAKLAGQAKGWQGIGTDTVIDYAVDHVKEWPGLTKNGIRTAMSELKTSDGYLRITKRVAAELSAQAAAEEAAESKRLQDRALEAHEFAEAAERHTGKPFVRLGHKPSPDSDFQKANSAALGWANEPPLGELETYVHGGRAMERETRGGLDSLYARLGALRDADDKAKRRNRGRTERVPLKRRSADAVA